MFLKEQSVVEFASETPLDLMNDLSQDFISTQLERDDPETLNDEETGSTCMKYETAKATSANFPEVALREIFRNIQMNTKTLLACRLVCTSWRNTIDNNAEFMRRLTFRVGHPLLFLDNIATRLRSISLEKELPASTEELENFMQKIGSTVESVAFNFDYRDTPAKKLMLSLILSHCTVLNELHILCARKFLIFGLGTKEIQLASSKITSLTINTQNFTNEDKKAFGEFILCLSRLATLNFPVSPCVPNNPDRHYVSILTPVCLHMEKYPGVLKKVIAVFRRTDSASEENKIVLTRFLLNAGKYGVIIDTICDLNALLQYEPPAGLTINRQSCSAITKGHLFVKNVSSDLVNLNRLQHCNNLQELKIFVSAVGITCELNVIQHVKNIRNLHLHSLRWGGRVPVQTFGQGMHSVQKLHLNGNIFESRIAFSSLADYFPSLAHLVLRDISDIPPNIFVALNRLEKLEILDLVWLNTLIDSMLLVPCVGNSDFPAIAGFKCVKEMNISGCCLLTDDCLVNGVSLSRSIKTLSVSCRKFTEIGYNAIVQAKISLKVCKICF